MTTAPVSETSTTSNTQHDDTQLRQDRDGTAYMALYLTPYGFAWDGDSDHQVEVCHGGMGEPVRWRFDPPGDLFLAESVVEVLDAFNAACHAWLGESE